MSFEVGDGAKGKTVAELIIDYTLEDFFCADLRAVEEVTVGFCRFFKRYSIGIFIIGICIVFRILKVWTVEVMCIGVEPGESGLTE